MARIRPEVWLQHARRTAAAAVEVAKLAKVRAHEARDNSADRRLRAQELIAKVEAMLARGRRRHDRAR